jgi:NAD(P)H-dependent FMN reductase
MKIFAFAGSNSSTSINKKLVVFSLRSFPNDQINLIDLNDYEMPLFSVDREKNGFPKEASLFLENINESKCTRLQSSLVYDEVREKSPRHLTLLPRSPR